MNAKHWLIGSVLLNVLLAAIWFAHARSVPAPTQEANQQTSDPKHSAVLDRRPPQRIGTNRRELIQPLRWADLQDQDLKEFATNLRAAGCPEATVFLIIFDEVRQKAQPRVTAIVDQVRDRYFEELAAVGGRFWDVAKPQVEQLEKLAEEMEDILEHALGRSTWSSFDDAGETRTRTALLEVLSPDETQAVVEVRARYAQSSSGGGPGQADASRRAEISRFESEELRALLGEQKYADLMLIESGDVSLLRERSGFRATPEEWKEIVATRSACKTTNAPDSIVTRALAGKLGTERALEFEAHGRPEYRAFAELIEEAGLPAVFIKQACELEAAFKKEEREIKSAPVPDAMKRAALSSLRSRKRTNLHSLLGDEAAEAYESKHPFY